jgi:hypothetical protein
MDIWVNIQSEHECNLLQKIMISNGKVWGNGDIKPIPFIDMYRDKTCILVSPTKSMLYSDLGSCQNHRDRIIVPFPEGIGIIQDMFERK